MVPNFRLDAPQSIDDVPTTRAAPRGSHRRRHGHQETSPNATNSVPAPNPPRRGAFALQRRSAGSAEVETATAPGLRRSGGSPAASAPRGSDQGKVTRLSRGASRLSALTNVRGAARGRGQSAGPAENAVCLCSTPRPRQRRFRRANGLRPAFWPQGQFPQNPTPFTVAKRGGLTVASAWIRRMSGSGHTLRGTRARGALATVGGV